MGWRGKGRTGDRRSGALVWLGVLASGCGVLLGFNAAIRLEGRVVDEAGRPLEGVRLDVRKSRLDLTSESFLSRDEDVLELSDGAFEVSCWNCSGVTLHFAKQGYYAETLQFHVAKPEDVEPGESRDLAVDDLEVVLRSSANAAKLVSYEGHLQTSADGPVTVAPLRRDLGSSGVRLERLDEPPSKAAQYRPGYVRLIAPVDATGALAAQPLPDVPGARMRFPAPPTVDFTPADAGVRLYRFTSENPQKVYRSMRTAPATGYQDSLVLDRKERTGGSYYFYFRSGDRYGKGKVVPPSFGHADGQEVVMSHIELRLNPDGSRNVESAF